MQQRYQRIVGLPSAILLLGPQIFKRSGVPPGGVVRGTAPLEGLSGMIEENSFALLESPATAVQSPAFTWFLFS